MLSFRGTLRCGSTVLKTKAADQTPNVIQFINDELQKGNKL